MDTEGSCVVTAFASYKTTRTKSGFSPAQLFFLRNVRTPGTPSLWQEPVLEEMVQARDRVRAARATKGEDRQGLPPLEVGDLVVGQHPKSSEWTLAGEVSAVTHGARAYYVKYHEGGGRLFTRADLKLDKSGVYGYTKAGVRQLGRLWGLHNPDIPVAQPGSGVPARRAEAVRSMRRRSERLLNKRRVTFLVGPEGEVGQ